MSDRVPYGWGLFENNRQGPVGTAFHWLFRKQKCHESCELFHIPMPALKGKDRSLDVPGFAPDLHAVRKSKILSGSVIQRFVAFGHGSCGFCEGGERNSVA
jgi:hypothetical protein